MHGLKPKLQPPSPLVIGVSFDIEALGRLRLQLIEEFERAAAEQSFPDIILDMPQREEPTIAGIQMIIAAAGCYAELGGVLSWRHNEHLKESFQIVGLPGLYAQHVHAI